MELNAKKKSFLNSLKTSNGTLNKLDVSLVGILKNKMNDSELGRSELLHSNEVSEPRKNLDVRKERIEISEDSLASRKDDFESSVLSLFYDYKGEGFVESVE